MFQYLNFNVSLGSSWPALYLMLLNHLFSAEMSRVTCCAKTHGLDLVISINDTPQKINIEPGNDGLEDDFPLPGVYSQVPC